MTEHGHENRLKLLLQFNTSFTNAGMKHVIHEVNNVQFVGKARGVVSGLITKILSNPVTAIFVSGVGEDPGVCQRR